MDEHGEPIIAAEDMLCSSFAFVARGHNVLAKSALERGLTKLSFSSISPVVVIMVTPAARREGACLTPHTTELFCLETPTKRSWFGCKT